MSEKTLLIKSPEHLLAQAYAMKCESEDRLQDLVDSLKQHNNMAAADIFSRTIDLIKLSLNEIELRVHEMDLPQIPPWEYQWYCDDQPDSVCIEKAHYLMTPVQALELAIVIENRFQEFFKQQTDNKISEDIRLIAYELAIHEKHLMKQLQSWKEQLDTSEIEQIQDFDPPNIPE